jgi:uncharacterized glyoxalase superfamily protein PhnB
VAEVRRGPARIQLVAQDRAWDSTFDERPRGSAVLFLHTDDVAGMRASIAARGGAVSELEKVNWIKMRVFQTRDPDGHILWFAEFLRGAGAAATPTHAAADHAGVSGVYIENADGLHSELVAAGASVRGEPVSQRWGLREFTVSDPEGNEITFAQTFE